jgi:diadenosine tetraphosphate (Ap4A) HIT family hydrolase
MSEAQWPADWAQRMAGRDCPMCGSVGHGDNDYWVHAYAGEFAEVNLERRARLPGYCLVVWRHAHIAEPHDLRPGEADGYFREVLAAGRAIRAVFDPVKVNYMTLGNTVPHLHTHVVPRYTDDPAPGGPLEWPQLFVPDPRPDAELHAQAARLRAQLAS